MPRKVLEAIEAAGYLKISYWTILDMAKKGKIPSFKCSSRVLFSQEALDEWITDQEKASVAQPEPAQYGQLRRIRG